jgi:hypothetical protein
MSGGEQQLLAIARGLMANPKLRLLDGNASVIEAIHLLKEKDIRRPRDRPDAELMRPRHEQGGGRPDPQGVTHVRRRDPLSFPVTIPQRTR